MPPPAPHPSRSPTGVFNLRQLESFVRVAELGSFSKAALVLGLAQPALSRQVRALETELRETLLVRTGRGVRLTPAGQRLFEHANALLQLAQRTRDELAALRDEPAGRVVVGLPPSMGRMLTVPLVQAFGQRWPKAQLAIVEGLSAHITEWIATGRIDLGLVHNPEPHAAIESVPLVEEDLCLVSPRPPRRTADAPVALQQLAALPLVLPERAHAYRKLLDTQAARAGLKLQVAWEVSSVQSIIDLVCAGHGHAVLTRSAAAASGRAAELWVRPLVRPRVPSVLCLVQSASKKATPLQREVAALLKDLTARMAGR